MLEKHPRQKPEVDDDPFEESVLCCLPRTNYVRTLCTRMIASSWFNNLSLVCIVLNSISMGAADFAHANPATYELEAEGSIRNYVVSSVCDTLFLVLFTLEAAIKIVGKGFICGEKTYLQDPWDRLDFAVVCCGLAEFVPWLPRVSFLRTMRILRPLRTVQRYPKMKAMVGALLASLSALLSVAGLLCFVFAVWGILAVQFWGKDGVMLNRCRLTPFPVKLLGAENATDGLHRFPIDDAALAAAYAGGLTTRCLHAPNDDEAWTTKASSPWSVPQHCAWPLDVADTRLCAAASSSGGHACTGGKTCGADFDRWGNRRFLERKIGDAALYVEDLNWGYTSFSHMGAAMLTLFQCITLEGWTAVEYQVQDSFSRTASTLYFTALTLFGGFFLLNMTLAVIEDAYSEQQERRQADQEAAMGVAGAKEKAVAAGLEQDEMSASRKTRYPWLYASDERAARFIRSPGVEHGFTAMIILNAIVLAMDSHPEDPDKTKVLMHVRFVLSMIFAAEMLVKMAGLGIAGFFSDTFYTFDCLVVITSLLELLVTPPYFLTGAEYVAGGSGGGGAVSGLRTFRLFRVGANAADCLSKSSRLLQSSTAPHCFHRYFNH